MANPPQPIHRLEKSNHEDNVSFLEEQSFEELAGRSALIGRC